jgi:hypothetical protein
MTRISFDGEHGMSQHSIRKWAVAWSFLFLALQGSNAFAASQWLTFPGKDGPGKGKHIVLVSGDEEYRSEEVMPQLAKILSERNGFDCTVLFEIDRSNGQIDPNQHNNIPGIEALDSADLMIILTRFRALPDDQMKHIDDYLKAGKPVIGLRTATHAFSGLKGEYEKYNNGYNGKDSEWADGFGRLVLGERWISHHGSHKNESTRALFAPDAKGSPLLNGIADGDIWVPTDVYGVRLPLPGDARPLLLGQVLHRPGPIQIDDAFYGMKATDPPLPGDKKNDPMMPIAWTKSYQLPGGKQGKSFCTTMGSAADITNEALRRLIVNATYHLLDLKIPEKANVDIVGDYKPSAFGFNGFRKGLTPDDYAR